MKNSSQDRTGPIRIAHIISHLNYGGVQRLLLDLVSNLDRTVLDPMIICLKEAGDFSDQFRSRGIKVHVSRIDSRWHPAGLWNLKNDLLTHRIQLVHTHMYRANTSGSFGAWLAKIPAVINHIHGINTWDKITQVWTDRTLLPLKDKIVFVSKAVEHDYCCRINVPMSKRSLIYNGIDISRFLPTLPNPDRNRRFRIGAIGRLDKVKGFDVLLRAAARAINENLDCEISILGEGREKERLIQLAQQLNLEDRVNFESFVEDITPFLRSLDLFVMPSVKEGFGLALVEAMAVGLPVIASAIGGLMEIIEEDRSGLLFETSNDISLFQKIMMLYNNPDKCRKLASNACQRAQVFSIENMVRSTQNLYKELIDAKNMRS